MLSHYLAFAFDRQLLLADVVQNHPWSYDLQTGILSFVDRFHWKAEVLGTESDKTGTWLWAWANETSNIPPEQQTGALKMKAIGEERGIVEFTEPLIPLDHGGGHAFASIAIGEGLTDREKVDREKVSGLFVLIWRDLLLSSAWAEG